MGCSLMTVLVIIVCVAVASIQSNRHATPIRYVGGRNGLSSRMACAHMCR